MTEVAVVDYGMGNLRSVEKALARTGLAVRVTSAAADVEAAAAVCLPGVGAYGACMANLRAYGLAGAVKDAALSGRPFLGICLGLQLLFEESEEFGRVEGLGVFPGRVRRFGGAPVAGLKIPHMGWNELRIARPELPELAAVADGTHFYFVHSYYVEPADPGLTVATVDYGAPFTAAVARGAVFACQFHPEKSQEAGARLLEGFARRVRESTGRAGRADRPDPAADPAAGAPPGGAARSRP